MAPIHAAFIVECTKLIQQSRAASARRELTMGDLINDWNAENAQKWSEHCRLSGGQMATGRADSFFMNSYIMMENLSKIADGQLPPPVHLQLKKGLMDCLAKMAEKDAEASKAIAEKEQQLQLPPSCVPGPDAKQLRC
jgi:hypothetical protein